MVRDATAEDAEAIARVHSAAWRDTYEGMLPAAVIAGFEYKRVLPRWRERLPATSPQSILVWSNPVAGYAYSGPARDEDPDYAGEVYAIYVAPERKREGGGRALMAASAESLATAGMTSMLVWVHRENHGARRFYEALGGRYVRAQPLGWAGAEAAVEVAYGWADTAVLRASAPG
jgi:ribosomal protein S18 acetylase RimI-like enzyme